MPYKDPDERKIYARQYNKVWNAKRRKTFFADKVCAKCGETDHLELDHIDPSTKISSSIWTWSEPRRLTEIAKCQVLCHDCHVEKTLAQGETNAGAKGEQNATARMSDDGMTRALELYATGKYTFREIGDLYGVHRDTIRRAWHGRSWKHLDINNREV